jgi:hypothetical protein
MKNIITSLYKPEIALNVATKYAILCTENNYWLKSIDCIFIWYITICSHEWLVQFHTWVMRNLKSSRPIADLTQILTDWERDIWMHSRDYT